MIMLGRSLLAMLLLGGLMACSLQPGSSNSVDATPSPQATASTPVSQVTTPSTKTTTIYIEGEPQQIPITLVQSPKFSTYYPSDRFTTGQAASGEGSATWFYWQQPDGIMNNNVYVRVVFPNNNNQSVDQVRQFLVGDRGIFRVNGWRTVPRGSGDVYAEKAYSSWLRDLILFEPLKNPQNIAGTAYIGEVDGRVFYVISHYPREYGDGFTPRADVILENIKGREIGLSRNSQLALREIGALQIGMTVDQASKAIGQPLIAQGESAPGSSCRYVAPQKPIQGLNFMVIDDRSVVFSLSLSQTFSWSRLADLI
jgi:hypothetical protein